MPSATAVHDLGLFELDRNAIAQPAPGDDWSSLYNGGANDGCSAPCQEFTGILPDIGADGGTQFQGGGSKDNSDITDWLWKPGEPLDKDDITNAYAAAYTNTVDTGLNNIGDLIVYFGMDRFDTNGSAQVGFWFLQDPNFGLTDTAAGGGFQFSGQHQDNDVLVQANFSNGGVIATAAVWKWQAGNLVLVGTTTSDCFGSPPDDAGCATVNQSPETAPWPYTNKDGDSGIFETSAFFEGGINLSRLVPGAGCFTGFLAETRTSTPFDARLKDFVTGNFDLCEIGVEKTGDTLGKVGDPADYTVTITNSGALTLYKDDISDDVLGAITTNGVDQANSNVVTNGCGASLAPGASCTITLRRTVLAGDPDPLVNTVTIAYNSQADLSGSAVSGTDDHSVNLFQPGVEITKSGPTLSKKGDQVTYSFSIDNTSSTDSPNLVLATISDTKLGDLSAAATAAGCDVLTSNPSETCNFTVNHTIPNDATDPYDNTVTVHYNPSGFTNDINDSDDHSINLFTATVDIDKTGDALSKVGDSVNYTITVSNTSSSDAPDLNCTVTDALLGVNQTISDFSPGDPNVVINTSRTVVAGDADPLVNTATVNCTVVGFPNTPSDSDTHSVNLFTATVDIDKTGDALSKVGDSVNYTITVSNTSSSDAPDLNCTVTDALLGVNQTISDFSPGDPNVVINTSRTVVAGDADPLVNTATVNCTVVGFPNTPSDSDTHSVNLFTATVDIDKTGDALSKVGDSVNYTITVSNTSSSDAPDLNCTVTDALLGVNQTISDFSPGDPNVVINTSRTVVAGDADPLVNTATVNCTVVGFPNTPSDSDTHSVNLFTATVDIDKTGDALSKVGDSVNYTITVSNTSSSDAPDLNCTVTDALLGVNQTISDFSPGDPNVVINTSRTVVAGDADPLVNTATVNCTVVGFPNTPSDSDTHSVNLFTATVDIDKTGDALSKVGDSVNYTITVSNTSSSDAPDLNCTVTDALLGVNQTISDFSPGDPNVVINTSRTVVAGDADPLVNTATVNCTVVGFPNTPSDSDTHSVDLVQPNYTLTKQCSPSQASIGQQITYTYTITNTGSVTLNRISANDTLLGNLAADFPASLAPGGSATIIKTRNVQAGDPDPLPNTVTTVYQVDGLPNQLTREASCSVDLIQGCAFSPGFWKTHPGTWDSFSDYTTAFGGTGTTAGEAGYPAFITTTLFPFQSFVPAKTYLEILNLAVGGDRSVALAQFYITTKLTQAYVGVPANIADVLKEIEDFFDPLGVDNTDSNLTDTWSVPVGSNPTGAARTEANRLQTILANYVTGTGETGCPTLPGS